MSEILRNLTQNFPISKGAGTCHFVLLCGTGLSSNTSGRLLSEICSFAWRLHSGGSMGTRVLAGNESIDDVFAHVVSDRSSVCLLCDDFPAIERFLADLSLGMLRAQSITFSVVVVTDAGLTVPDWCSSYRLPEGLAMDAFSLAGNPWIDAFLASDRFVAQVALSVTGGSAGVLCREIREIRKTGEFGSEVFLSEIDLDLLQRCIELWCCIFQLSGRQAISASYSLSAMVQLLLANARILSLSSAGVSPE